MFGVDDGTRGRGTATIVFGDDLIGAGDGFDTFSFGGWIICDSL